MNYELLSHILVGIITLYITCRIIVRGYRVWNFVSKTDTMQLFFSLWFDPRIDIDLFNLLAGNAISARWDFNFQFNPRIVSRENAIGTSAHILREVAIPRDGCGKSPLGTVGLHDKLSGSFTHKLLKFFRIQLDREMLEAPPMDEDTSELIANAVAQASANFNEESSEPPKEPMAIDFELTLVSNCVHHNNQYVLKKNTPEDVLKFIETLYEDECVGVGNQAFAYIEKLNGYLADSENLSILEGNIREAIHTVTGCLVGKLTLKFIDKDRLYKGLIDSDETGLLSLLDSLLIEFADDTNFKYNRLVEFIHSFKDHFSDISVFLAIYQYHRNKTNGKLPYGLLSHINSALQYDRHFFDSIAFSKEVDSDTFTEYGRAG